MAKTSGTRVLVVDDHPAIRYALRSILDSQDDIQVVDEAEDGYQAVELSKKHNPDVVILDITMPGEAGLEAAHSIRKISPDTRIVILTMHKSEEILQLGLDMGVSAYLLKDEPLDAVIPAVRAAMRGERTFGPGVVTMLADKAAGGGSAVSVFDSLSSRERQVLKLVADGRTSKEIGIMLDVSVKTVESHRANLFRKLQCESLADLIKIAIRNGLSTL